MFPKQKTPPTLGVDLWWNGPTWLAMPELWPVDVLNKPSEESQAKAKLVSKVLKVAVNDKNEIEELLCKFPLQKAIQICAGIRRFAHNSLHRQGAPRIVGPLTT